MEIGPVQNNQPIQQPSQNSKPQPSVDVAKGEIIDRVEISEDARRMLAEMADRALLEEATAGGVEASAVDNDGMSEAQAADKNQVIDKLAEIRRRIESGYYDQPEIQDRIADRLSDELDL
jgi:hypothetical protein